MGHDLDADGDSGAIDPRRAMFDRMATTAKELGIGPLTLAFWPVEQVVTQFKSDPNVVNTANGIIRVQILPFCHSAAGGES